MSLSSQRTRLALAESLKRQLKTTTLSKITVSSLVADAGITRQAFYYHFHDIYELVEWVFTTDVANHIMRHASLAEWHNGLEILLTYFQKNKDQVISVIRSIDYQKLEKFFYESFASMMETVVDDVIAQQAVLSPSNPAPPAEDREFVIEHFTSAVVGHTLHWIAGDMSADPHLLVRRMECVMHGQVAVALRRLRNFEA